MHETRLVLRLSYVVPAHMLRAALRPSVARLAMPPKRKAGAVAAAAPAKAAKAESVAAPASGDAAVSIEACKS